MLIMVQMVGISPASCGLIALLPKCRSTDAVRGNNSQNQDRNRGQFGVRREVMSAEFEFLV